MPSSSLSVEFLQNVIRPSSVSNVLEICLGTRDSRRKMSGRRGEPRDITLFIY